MRYYLIALLALVASALTALAGDFQDQTFTTLSGEKYENATVAVLNPLEISVATDSGVARIPFANLSRELRARFGYDPQKAAAVQAAFRLTQQQALEAQGKQKAELAKANAKYETIRNRLRLEASRRLLMASREDQLRAALSERLLRQRRGKPLSATEFEFLDEETRTAIALYNPDLLPNELLPPQ